MLVVIKSNVTKYKILELKETLDVSSCFKLTPPPCHHRNSFFLPFFKQLNLYKDSIAYSKSGIEFLFQQQTYWNWHNTPERANYEGKTKVAEKPLRLHCLLETEHAQIYITLQKQELHTAP